MSRAIAFLACACLWTPPVLAADIAHTRIKDLDVITVTGEIQPGDDAKFRQLSVAYSDAVVALDSPGGSLVPALEIGKVIKINEHRTVVTDGSVCTSACALIWVAGSTKYLSATGRVGFHASYKDEAGRKVETGLGNALVGHYLGLLNLPEKAVVFATVASPTEIIWLNESNMNKAGIEFKPFAAAASKVAKPIASAAPSVPASATPAATITSAPQAVILSAPTDNVLRAGTEVPLIMAESISSNNKTLRSGQQIRMQVAASVMLGSVTVIPVGSPATAEITEVRHKGMWGKSGRIEARVLSVRVGDRLIRLSGTFDDKGVTGTAGVVGAIVFVPIAGFFLTGTSASIPAGAGVKAFLDEDLRISAPAPAPTVTTVAAPAH